MEAVNESLNNSKPLTDHKSYRVIEIPSNGLRCLLVSQNSLGNDDDDDSSSSEGSTGEEDEASDDVEEGSDKGSDKGSNAGGSRRAAVCMSVGVGSFYDPRECMGLAHFLEHMLFMGSEKYPTENAFDSFISKAGGGSNAYTEGEHTSFYFTCSNKKLSPSLDMFSQFFVSPLMLQDAVDRELNAIESEFQLSKSSNGNRLQEIVCRTAKKDHPLSKFGWGNNKSLREDPLANGVDPVDMLKGFYNEHYVAENMALCLQASFPLDTLEQLAIECCSSIRSSGVEFVPRSLKHHGFPLLEATDIQSQEILLRDRKSLRCIIYMVPIVATHRLYLTWQLPPIFSQYKSKSYDYLTHLIGHEASGGLLHRLKSQSLADDLTSGGEGSSYDCSTASSFIAIEVSLTQLGVYQWRQVVETVLEYLAMLKQVGPQEWIQDELAAIAKMDYQYQPESDPEDNVQDLSMNMLSYRGLELCDLLAGPHLIQEWKPEEVTGILDRMNVEGMRIDICSSIFGQDQEWEPPTSLPEFPLLCSTPPLIEPYFGSRFWIEALPMDLLNTWKHVEDNGTMVLPPPNKYIARDLALKPFNESNDLHPLVGAYIRVHVKNKKVSELLYGFIGKFNSTEESIVIWFDDADLNPRFKKYFFVDVEVAKATAWSGITTIQLSETRKHTKVVLCDVIDHGMSNHNPQKLMSCGRRFLTKVQNQREESWDYIQQQIPVVLDCYHPLKMSCSSKFSSIWSLQDRIFRRPKTDICIHIFSDAKNNPTPLKAVALRIFVNLVIESLTHDAYIASMAELQYSLRDTDMGIRVIFQGFNHKIFDFVDVFLEHLFGKAVAGTEENEKNFFRVKELMERKFHNISMKSNRFASNIRLQCLRDFDYDQSTLQQALSELTSLETIRNFVMGTFFTKISLESFLMGNIDCRKDSETLQQLVTKYATSIPHGTLPAASRPYECVYRLPVGISVLEKPAADVNDLNTTLELYIQLCPDDLKLRVCLDLLEHFMSEPIYDTLRTNHQLGYSVSCSVRVTNGILGYVVDVTSATHSAEQLQTYVLDFLESFVEDLEKMTNSAFEDDLGVLMELKLEDDCNMYQVMMRHWNAIVFHNCKWDRIRKEAFALVGLTKVEHIAFYRKWILPSSADARILSVRVSGNDGTSGRMPDSNIMDKLKLMPVISVMDLHTSKWDKPQ